MALAEEKAAAAGGEAAVAVSEIHTGQCQCGSLTFRAAALRDIWYCHCRQCRRATGHYMAACRTERERIEISGEVRWAAHSGASQQGFCQRCGSLLFWQQPDKPTMSVAAGALDNTDGIEAQGHIFTAEKGAYYTISDGLPQWPGQPDGGC